MKIIKAAIFGSLLAILIMVIGCITIPWPTTTTTTSTTSTTTTTTTTIPSPVSTLIKCSMFIPAKVPQAPWVKVGPPWPDSTQAYVKSHGSSWENDYRNWCVTSLQNWGANSITYYAEKLKGKIELEMYLVDTASPVDGHHIADKSNFCVLLKNAGVTTHIPILTSEDMVWNNMEALIKDLSNAYKTSRGISVIWLIGLESNRNVTIDQIAQIAKWVRQYAGESSRIVCGSKNYDWLISVHNVDAKIELWKEQNGHPINEALTAETAPKYLTDLGELAKLVGADKVWAGEWWCMDEATRKSITSQILAKGYNCGCGQFK